MNLASRVSQIGPYALGLALIIAGCATIVSGTSQEVSIRSSPSQAHVSIERTGDQGMETVWEGTTPATAKLKRKHSYLLTVSMDGYRPAEMSLENGTNGWVWGNLIFGGPIGAIIDLSNGAAKKLKPDEIDVELISVTAMGPDARTTLYAVFRIMDADGHLRVSPVPLTAASVRRSALSVE